MEPEFYVRNRTGELMSRATNDLNAVRMVLGPGIMYSATTLVTMVLAMLVMFTLSPSLSLWVLIPVPIVAVAVRFFGSTIHALYEKIQASLATLSAQGPGKSCRRPRRARLRAGRSRDSRLRRAQSRIRLAQPEADRTWSMFMPPCRR